MINNRPNDRNGPAKATQPSAGEATTARGRVEIEMPRLVPPTPSGPPNSRTIAPPTGIGRRPRASGKGVLRGRGGGSLGKRDFGGEAGRIPEGRGGEALAGLARLSLGGLARLLRGFLGSGDVALHPLDQLFESLGLPGEVGRFRPLGAEAAFGLGETALAGGDEGRRALLLARQIGEFLLQRAAVGRKRRPEPDELGEIGR